jgi:hypothetical protein
MSVFTVIIDGSINSRHTLSTQKEKGKLKQLAFDFINTDLLYLFGGGDRNRTDV